MVLLAGTCLAGPPSIARAQAGGQGGALSTTQPAPTGDSSSVGSDGTVARGFRRLPPQNTYTVWVGGSVATLTASDNETIRNGSLRLVGVQWTRDLFSWHSARFSWVTEVLPLISATSSAPAVRVPPSLRDPSNPPDPKELARYLSHDSWGFGVSPLSAQAELTHSPRLSTIVQVTSGGAWFSEVVPYGKATQFNFTVSPSAALQWSPSPRTRIAFGYTLHHLSNASIGGSNPGMNSHLFFTRVSSIGLR